MTKRSYKQYCGLAKALDVVGQRWTLLIVRNLLLGPLRYTDLHRGLPGVTTNLLADRLREMEGAGLIEKARSPAPYPVDVYRLTTRGRALEPAIHAFGAWGWQFMKNPARGDATDPAWAMLALKRRYQGVADELLIHLVAGDQSFTIQCFRSGVQMQRGTPVKSDIELTGSFGHIRDLLFGGMPISELISAGALEFSGSQKSLRTFLGAFGLSRSR